MRAPHGSSATCSGVRFRGVDRVGIIGAGNIGGNLTRRLTGLGHEVRVANSRGPETLGDLAGETGATAVDVGEAAVGAEIVIVTIPLKNVPALPDGLLREAADGLGVIDTNNYYYPQQREPGTPVYGATADAAGITSLLSDAPRERPADFRA